MFFWSGTARARSLCTQQRSRITESSVFKQIHHKDRRQLQLSRRRWLHDCTASYVRGVSPSWSLRGGTRVSSGLIARQIEELEESFAAGLALQLFPFQDTSDWPPLSSCAFVQSRRRPEKSTRTRKWDSRCSVRVDSVCVCTLFGLHFLSQDDGGG